MAIRALTAAVLSLGLIGCGSSEPVGEAEETPMAATTPADGVAAAAPTRAVATLQNAQGAPAGTVTATGTNGGLMISLEGQGLTPGEHGVHVHMTGRCDAPAFETAGGHWNPAGAKHGLENPEGQHAGDMPNLTVAADGTGTLQYDLKGGTIEGLLDEDGSAFVIHAKADDQRTDPSGNSGDRIACGVFARG